MYVIPRKNGPRPLTVTGGMPNFGGPGNNYSLHAICSMVELLRKNPSNLGMVQALSWFISKHSVGIYSGEFKTADRSPISADYYTEKLSHLKKTPLVDEASGEATIETYVLFHDRQGKPINGVIIGKMNDGSRFLAKTDNIVVVKTMESILKQVSFQQFEIWDNSDQIHRSTLTKERKKVSWEIFQELFRGAVPLGDEFFPEDSKYLWKGKSVFEIDGSKFTLPATAEIREDLDPKSGLKHRSKEHYPQCLINTVYDVLRHLPVARTIVDNKGSEREKAAPISAKGDKEDS